MITAEDVLTVLNDLKPIDLADLEFAVAVEPGHRPTPRREPHRDGLD